MPSMRSVRTLVATAVTACAVGLAACGSDDPDEPPPPATDAVADGPSPTTPAPSDTSDGGGVIGSANVGGTVVDPQPWPIDAIDVAESVPEQLMVRFTAGDPQCTAATGSAIAVGDSVLVMLEVGITEDAMARSCRAGAFEQTLPIALDEGLDGRDVEPGL